MLRLESYLLSRTEISHSCNCNFQVHFKHPNFENHEVRCKSIETAKLWLEEFVETKELDEAEKSPSSPKKKSVDALDDGSSDRKHKLLAVDRKSHKELVGLFYSLNQVSSYLTKTVLSSFE